MCEADRARSDLAIEALAVIAKSVALVLILRESIVAPVVIDQAGQESLVAQVNALDSQWRVVLAVVRDQEQ
jgi:hypothetical protein